jgi:uncharacterized protein (TIGR02594 family)
MGYLIRLALMIGAVRRVMMNDMQWMMEARAALGIREVPGLGNAPAIIGWARALGLTYGGDSTPWCGLFVAHCLRTALPQEKLPATPLVARRWSQFGISCLPQVGAVLVFWRGSRRGWSGHVGFYAGEDADAFLVLGGNQGDRVSLAWLSKDRLLAARWPLTADAPNGGAVPVARREGLSTNEG